MSAGADVTTVVDPHRIVVTAGHVDHGKSSLVRALTGTDPDRLAEEHRRGLTLELGFAFTEIDGRGLSFVDVPGHARYVHNMLAGVGALEPPNVSLRCAGKCAGFMPKEFALQ